MTNPIVEVSIKKKLPGFNLDVSWSSNSGITVLFGESGVGKTLTLQCLAGLVQPDYGRIVIEDKVYFDSVKRINLPPQKRKVGYVFQDYALFPHLTVFGNIAYGAKKGRKAKEDLNRLIDLFGLGNVMGKYPSEISGGQKQRTALARAIASSPRLFLLDEPLSALDGSMREKFRMNILKIRSVADSPIVYVTHSLDEIFTLADRVVVIDNGRVLETGGKEDILSRPQRRRTAELVGVENIFPCIIKDIQEGLMVLSLSDFGVVAHSDPRFKIGQKAYLCIKPMDVRLIVDGRRRENTFEGTVFDTLPQEKIQRVFLDLNGYRFVMDMEKRVCERWKVRTGQRLRVYLRMESIFLTK